MEDNDADGLSVKMQSMIRKFCDFLEFVSHFNEYYGKPSMQRLKRKTSRTSSLETDKNSLFSCGEELPDVTLHKYVLTIFSLLELDDTNLLIAPLAYILRL